MRTKKVQLRANKKREKHVRKRKTLKKIHIKRNKGLNLIHIIFQTISNFYPDLFDYMREIEDHRKKPDYEIAEIITACIAMFLFKEGSRNAFNNDRVEENFMKNYKKIFKVCLPHMDTVDRVIRVLKEKNGLEQLKTKMVKTLLLKKLYTSFVY